MLSVVFPVTFFSWVAELTRLGCTLDLDKGFDLVASRSAWRLLLFTCFGPCGVRVSLRQLLLRTLFLGLRSQAISYVLPVRAIGSSQI
jgi:hypothetical protein